MTAAAPIILMAGTQLASGFMESQALKRGAKVDEENARLTQLEGAYQTEDIRRAARATQGEAIAALADNGVSVGDGSAQDLLFQNQLEAEYQVLSTRYGADREAYSQRMAGYAKRGQARSAMIGGVLRAGAAAITGFSNMKDNQAEAAAMQRRQEAYFPGGQRLPMPPGR